MLPAVAISNKKSGKNRWDWKKYREYRGQNRIKEIIKDGDHGKLYVTGESKDYLAELDSVMIDACKLNPDLFIFDGGDSSIMTGVTLLDRHWPGRELPLIATTKGGSFLMLPKRLKQKRTFEFLENIVNAESIDDLTVKGIELMKVKDENNEYLSFSTGTGLLVDMLDEVYKRKSLKYLYAAALYLRTLASVMICGDYYKRFEHKQPMHITMKGHGSRMRGRKSKLEGDFLGIAAQTIDYAQCFPWPFSKMKLLNIFNKAETPGMFQAMGTTWDFDRLFKYGFIGELEAALTFNRQLKEMRVQADKPFRYQSNGDFSFGHTSFLTRDLMIKAYKTVDFVVGR